MGFQTGRKKPGPTDQLGSTVSRTGQSRPGLASPLWMSQSPKIQGWTQAQGGHTCHRGSPSPPPTPCSVLSLGHGRNGDRDKPFTQQDVSKDRPSTQQDVSKKQDCPSGLKQLHKTRLVPSTASSRTMAKTMWPEASVLSGLRVAVVLVTPTAVPTACRAQTMLLADRSCPGPAGGCFLGAWRYSRRPRRAEAKAAERGQCQREEAEQRV